MYVKNLLFVALCTAMILSCKKNSTKPPAKEEVKLTINKFNLKQYDNVEIEASIQGIPEGDIGTRGFYWSLSPKREISDSAIRLFQPDPFSAAINGIGQNSTLYLRAFVETFRGTFFSDSIVVNTSGLQLLWKKEHIGFRRRIKQLVPTGTDGFLLLIENMNDVIKSWPELMRIDTSGNIVWARYYYPGEIKTPQGLLPVQDGYLVTTKIGFRGPAGIIVFKTDLNGVKLWETTVSGKAYQDFVRMIALPNQTVRVTTRGYDTITNGVCVNASIDDYVLDGHGQVISAATMATLANNNTFNASSDNLYTLNLPDGGFVSVPAIKYSDNGAGIIRMQKFNNAYQLAWEQSYPLPGIADPVSIATNNAGNYLLMGSLSGKTVAMQIDKSSGAKLWDYRYESWKFGNASKVGMLHVNIDQYYIATDGVSKDGYKRGPLLIRLDQNGQFLYEYLHHQVGQPLISQTDAIYTNANKEIYLFGTSFRSLSADDANLFVVKLKER
jgi:outer membrane protein assembly factor BamB